MAQLNLVPSAIPTIDYSEDEKDIMQLISEGPRSDDNNNNDQYDNPNESASSLTTGNTTYSPYASGIPAVDSKNTVYEIFDEEA
jgi:hypothetical protein